MTLGDAVVTVIASVHGWRFRPPYTVSDVELKSATADADEQARLSLDFMSAHVATGGLSIVVDPGRVSAEQRARYAGAEITPGVDGALAELGIAAEEVTHVFVSHHHHDHFTGITSAAGGAEITFPNARHLVSRIDFENQGPQPDVFERHWAPVREAGLVDLVDGDSEIAPGLTVLAIPGETAGHQGLRVESLGSRFYWVGDLLHHQIEATHLDWALAGSLQPAMEVSRRRVLEEAADDEGVVVWAHAPFPGWGRVGRGPAGYTWTWIAGEDASRGSGR
jgi:glyoxylase-like metal-dependent hydrolase (beta-lactamase superfamily II)